MLRVTIGFCSAVWLLTASSASAQGCQADGVALQILGSGGPQLNRDRSSTSYLLWIAGRAQVLIDVGGGAFQRFGQSGAQFGDLALIAVSHLHPDHVSDLPAVLWGGLTRGEPLAVAGPSGNDAAPAFSAFLGQLFDQKSGAFRMLGAALGGPGRGVRLEVTVADATKPEPSVVYDRNGLTVTAMGMPHGNVPSLSYRVRAQNATVVFSSDQTGADPRFVEFARGADLLVMHLAIAGPDINPLHATPGVVGRVARDAGVRRLVLGHIGQFDLEPAVAEVKKAYTGPVTVGADLQCTSLK